MFHSKFFRISSLSLLALVALAFASSASAQLSPWEDYEPSEAVWSITTVKLEPGTFNIYLEGLKSTWVAANEIAKELGHVEDYAIYANQAVARGAFDLMLVIKYPNSDMTAPSRERYNEFMKAWGEENMDNSNETVRELYNEIREIQGEYMIREVIMK